MNRLACPAIFLFAACGSPTEPLALTFELEGSFTADSIPAIAVEAGGVVATGVVTLLCSPHSVEGRTERDGATIRLVVFGRFIGGCPADGIWQQKYRATITGLRPGGFRVQLQYDLEGGVPVGTVLDTTVAVP
jgi:hypothetical protein